MAEQSVAAIGEESDCGWSGGDVLLHETAEVFTNGFDVDIAKNRFKTVVETAKKKKAFRESGVWNLTTELFVLPFLWELPNIMAHYVGDLFRVNTLVGKTLGYDSVVAYIETRGWMIKKIPKSTRFNLEYRKVDEAIVAAPSGEGSLGLVRNLKAMIDVLYDTLTSDVPNDPFTGKGTARFLKKPSFISKVNQYAQELQAATVIVKQIILPAIETVIFPTIEAERENILLWTKKIFKGCRRRKQFIMFCHNFLSLVPNDGNVTWCQSLLKDHPDDLMD